MEAGKKALSNLYHVSINTLLGSLSKNSLMRSTICILRESAVILNFEKIESKNRTGF